MNSDRPEREGKSAQPDNPSRADSQPDSASLPSSSSRAGGTRQDVARLVSQACDGQLDDAEKSRLERMLSADEDLRSHYVTLVVNDALLEGRFAKPLLENPGLAGNEATDASWQAAESGPNADVRPRTLTKRNQSRIRQSRNGTKPDAWWLRAATSRWAAIAAILVATASIGLWVLNRPVATVVAANQAELSNGHFLTAGDKIRPSAWLQLKAGSLQVRFRTSALVALSGSTRFRATGKNECELAYGSLRGQVPEKATGFVVQTPAFTVEDLGTSFSLVAEQNGPCSVYVTDGEVRVINRSQTESLSLSAGQVVVSDSSSGSDGALEMLDSSQTKPIVRGDFVFLPEHVPSLAFGDYNHNGRAYLFLESRDRLLPIDLPMNIASPGYYTDFEEIRGELPRGTKVHCYLLHCAPFQGAHEVSGSITLPGEILGVICSHDRMNKTNSILGADWTLKCGHIHRGLERTPAESADVLKLSRDRRTLSATLRNKAIDQIRILVKAE